MSTLNTQGSAVKDNGPAWAITRTHTVSADMSTTAAISAAPAAAEFLVADDILISSDTQMNIILEEETTGTDLAKVFVPAYGTVQVTLRSGLKVPTAGKRLFAKASASGNVAFTVCQHSEDR